MAKRKRNKKPTPAGVKISGYVQHDIDLVIPVYGNLELLRACVNSIVETCDGLNYKLIIVDDFSPETERESLNEYYQTLTNRGMTIIKLKKNSGYPHAVNVGVEKGNSKFAFAINSDTVLKAGCIQEMVRVLSGDVEVPQSPIERTPQNPIGVVGAKLTFPASDPGKIWGGKPVAGTIQHAGMHMDINQFPQHTHLGWPSDHPTVNTIRRVQFVTGALIGFRRDVWDAIKRMYRSYGDPTVGAMNEIYGKGTFEDIEFCVMARQMGHSVVYAPKAEATHAVGKSLGLSIENKDGGYDLRRNGQVFSARCSDFIVWDNVLATDLPDETVHKFMEANTL